MTDAQDDASAVPAAALILADHIAFRYYAGNTTTAPARCDCGWRGALCDHPAHLAEVLDRAGLLAARTPPETPTTRVPDERACPACAGVGWTPDVMGEGAEVECPDCAGSGRGNRSITVAEQDDRRTT